MRLIKTYRFVALLMLGSLVLFACKNGDEITKPVTKENPETTYKKIFHDGIRQKMLGNYDKAIELFHECLTYNPQSDAAHFALSELYEITNQGSQAIEHAQKAFELDPTNKWYMYRCGDLYFAQGNYERAAYYYGLGIKDEKSLDRKFRYTEALIFSGQQKKAIAMLDEIELETGKVPEISMTKHDLYLELGENEKAKAELQSLIDFDPYNMSNRMIVIDYFLQTNQLDAAEKMINETLAINPNAGDVLIAKADIYLRNGKMEEAFGFLNQAFVLDNVELDRKLGLIWDMMPYSYMDSPEAEFIGNALNHLFELIYNPALKSDRLHSYYGIFLKNRGELSKAREQFALVVEINPGSYNSWNQLINLDYDLANFNEMMKDCEQALELFPSQPMLYLLAGIAGLESGQYEKGEEYLYLGKDLIVNDKELSSEFYCYLGKIASKQKDNDKAFGYFDQALQYNAYNDKVIATKALILYDQGKKDEAFALLKSGMEKINLSATLKDTYGVLLTKEKRYNAAIEQLLGALVLSENNGFILEHLGDAYFLSGDTSKGLDYWKKAQENGNNLPLLLKKIETKSYHDTE